MMVMMSSARTAWLLFLWIASEAQAWMTCGSDSGAVCPDLNTCCLHTNEETFCISGSHHYNTTGSCCQDDDIDSDFSTACGQGYTCAVDSKQFCDKIPGFDVEKPSRVPRLRQCSLPAPAFQQVYGFSIYTKHNEMALLIQSEGDILHPNLVNADATVRASALVMSKKRNQQRKRKRRKKKKQNNSNRRQLSLQYHAVLPPQLAYLSNKGPIDSEEYRAQHALVETVVIMVHGSSRNADDYLCTTSVTYPPVEAAKYLVLTPWFVAPEDGPVPLYNRDATVQPLFWDDYGRQIGHTWRYGANAIHSNISSYATMDALVEYFMAASHQFPNLRRIVVAGHSAGGQLTHRWALLSNSHVFQSSTGIALRIVVANPKSYCFLDARRFVYNFFAITWYDPHDNMTLWPPESVEWTPDPHKFVVPNGTAHNCRYYNEWEWGLDEGHYLSDMTYRDESVRANNNDTLAMARRYVSERDVVYLSGELDTIPNGNCAAAYQGHNRRQRSRNFFASLQILFQDEVRHHRLVVPEVPHDHGLMFQSEQGRQALYGTFQSD